MGERNAHDAARPDDPAPREETAPREATAPRAETIELDSAGVHMISVEDFERRIPPREEADVKAPARRAAKEGAGE